MNIEGKVREMKRGGRRKRRGNDGESRRGYVRLNNIVVNVMIFLFQAEDGIRDSLA